MAAQSNNIRGILIELRKEIVDWWLPKCKESVQACENARDEVNSFGGTANTVKKYSAVAKGISHAAAGVLNIGSAIFRVPKLGLMGAAVAMVGAGSEVIKAGADSAKAYTFPKKLEEAQTVIDEEKKAFEAVSDKLRCLGAEVHERGTRGTRSHPYKNLVDTALNLLSSYNGVCTHAESGYHFVNTHAGEVATEAGSTGALDSLRSIAASKDPINSPFARADIIKDLASFKDDVITVATKEAKAALDKSSLSSVLPSETIVGLAESSGKNNTEAAYKVFEQYSEKKGGRLLMHPDFVKPAQNSTMEIADAAVCGKARKLADENMKSHAFNVENAAKKITSESWATSIGDALSIGLPLLASSRGVYSASSEYAAASTDLVEGTEEEQFLKANILKLKRKANSIVQIFNNIAAGDRKGLHCIDTPFP